jgi:16S rRNA (cytosine1402-N4)-methyltransferase
MIEQVVEGLNIQPNAHIIDATLGGGGHAKALLKASAPNGKLLGIDLDEEAIERTKGSLAEFGDRVKIRQGNYTEIKKIAYEQQFSEVGAILLDLGLSSDQLKSESRGFGINTKGKLDMRFSSQMHTTAADIVNTWPENDLATIFTEYGEERHAARAAKAIASARKLAPIETIEDLLPIVISGAGTRGWQRIHPATRIFQALRIATNKELDNLKEALPEMISLLSPPTVKGTTTTVGGRMAVITFHSLEDRIVKQYFKSLAKADNPSIKLINKKVIKPEREEILENRASRSAKLRIIERIK